jgi:hypothetical protein
VRFTADAHPGLAKGEITVTFRGWSRPQVKVGGRYRVTDDIVVVVDELRQVAVADIGDADARQAGEVDAAALAARLAKPSRGRYASGPSPRRDIHADTMVWRVDFHRIDPDAAPRLADQADLDPADVAEIARRLARLDAAAPGGPWTEATLRLIARRPEVVSTELAAELGRERAPFKVDVRKLKRLGLTISLDVGYRLSPRGEAYLAGLDAP